ncbi:MAG: hypothetical protein WBA67_04030 [Jannaschia sp.]
MGRLGTYTRHRFLIASAAVAGDVVFAVRAYRANVGNPPLAGLPPRESALTPDVKITAEGITIITPRAEMGQGIHTTRATLVAQKRDVELSDISVDHGPLSSADFNDGVVEEGYHRPGDGPEPPGRIRARAAGYPRPCSSPIKSPAVRPQPMMSLTADQNPAARRQYRIRLNLHRTFFRQEPIR